MGVRDPNRLSTRRRRGRAGLPAHLTLAGLGDTELTPHSMRHSFATWHIMRDPNAKWIQQQLGYASIALTFDVYGDWFKIADAQAADPLGRDLVGTKLVPDA